MPLGRPESGEQLRRPCRVDNLCTPVPNFKDFDAEGFAARALLAVEQVRQLQIATAAPPSEATEAVQVEAPATVAVPGLGASRLCTESQLTFTVPPDTPPFYIRFRVNVDGRKGSWQNPLTWEDGYFFSPRLRADSGGVALPPPLLLSAEWEKANIEGKWTWQEQVAHPEEGELRLFTLAGLTPSVAMSGLSGLLVGWAGQGLFGIRTVELEFAECAGQSWEETEWWTLMEPLEYILPSVDAGTAMLTLALNWGRSQGVKKMQEALVSELGQKNRKANVRMIRDFVQDMHEKVMPVWHSSVQPWMAQNPTLGLLVPECRGQMLRRRIVELMEALARRGAIQDIPPALRTLRPRLLSLQCSLRGAAVDSSEWVELQEGEELTLAAEATPIAAGIDALKMWWLVPSTNEPGLDMLNLIGQASSARSGPGGKVRWPTPAGEGERQGIAHSELHLLGRNQWGNPVLQAGTELTVRVVAEERGAHEDDYRDVRLRVVAGSGEQQRSTAEAGQRELPSAGPQNPEAPYRRTAPRIWALVRPSTELAEQFAAAAGRGCGSAEAARAALEAAGCRPTPADVADAAAAAGDEGEPEARAERFASWYKNSVFGSSLLEEGWHQVQATLRSRRNRFLAETLEIPRERWGFREDEWGGIVPEMGLMQQHVVCVAKQHLASVWASLGTTRLTRSTSEEASAQGVEHSASSAQRAPVSPLRLDHEEDVKSATLLAVSEALSTSMAKHYMSELLPTAAFGEEQRREWADTAVQNHSVLASAAQLVAFRLAEYFRISHSQETAAARGAAAAEAAMREKAAAAWLEAWRTAGAAAGPPPDGVDLLEVTKAVAKTAVQREVAHFLEVQLLPMVRSQLRERILPALAGELRDGVVQWLCKRPVRVVLALLAGTSALTTVTLGPWVALFLLSRRQRPLF